MPNVDFVRDELKKILPIYETIEDCAEGAERVKARGIKYLPKPNPSDISPENAKRYEDYKKRAVFYNVTKRTLSGLVGAIFARDPVVSVPADLAAVEADANGGGVSLTQLAKRACGHVLALGRCGLLVDYPVTEQGATLEELQTGSIRPTINVYKPQDIINWRTITVGSRVLLSLVVLREKYIYEDDGFEMKEERQWRVLSLVGGVYSVAIWRRLSNADFAIAEGPFFPTDGRGNNLQEIPFAFIGSENNDEQVDFAPLADIAELNVGHYRNSADYEESSYIVGQPTPYFTGLTESWVSEVLKGQIQLGARAAVPLPEGGGAGLLQASANSIPFEAMEHKERQMVALGAKLVEQSSVQRTATEVGIENASETSVLASVAKNVGSAFEIALNWCALFANASGEVEFKLNSDFDISKMTPQQQAQLISAWQNGALSFTEMRDGLRKGGVATQNDLQAKNEIETELAQDLQNQVDKAAAMAEVAPAQNNFQQ